MNQETKATIDINKRQKEFYNSTKKNKKNFVSRIWSKLRNKTLSSYTKQFNLKEKVYNHHKLWLGDLTDKKVLDLGCYRGNALSLYMAKNCKEYIAIDLSDAGLQFLRDKIAAEECKNAKVIAVDFLSEEFGYDNFDIIYAYGVLHHFEHVDLLIKMLNKKLATGGSIISYDPLETSFPIKVLRMLYRPFQSDKDWEWPFNKKTLKKFETNFHIKEKKGILGRSKYGVPLSILPLTSGFKTKVVQKMIEKDWDSQNWNDIYSCMHLTMLLEKK